MKERLTKAIGMYSHSLYGEGREEGSLHHPGSKVDRGLTFFLYLASRVAVGVDIQPAHGKRRKMNAGGCYGPGREVIHSSLTKT